MCSKIPNVYIVIVNYNGYKDTIECLKSLNNIYYNRYKIVVVDNNSTDKSYMNILKFIKEYNHIILIKSLKNGGFSYGNNIGIKFALDNDADYICLINNDTEVEKNFLCELINSMELDSDIGVSAGKIMYFNEPNKIWSAGGYISNLKSLGIHYGIDCEDIEKFNENKEVTFLTGCLQVIRREVFEKIGLYDESYFLYMEDVDFCLRVKNAGYKLMYIYKSKIYHKVSASTGGSNSPISLYYMTRNRMIFNDKLKNTLFEKTVFKFFYKLRIIAEIIRRKKKFKYVKEGIKDYKKKKYGQKDLSKV